MYDLDTNAAKQADQKGGSISDAGRYMGTFTRAEHVESKKGTKGVEFSFKSDDGRTADYLTLWTINNEGKQLYGYKTLNAIMTCLKVRHLAPTAGKVEKYSHDSGQREMIDAQVFAELMNKPIGLLLVMEEYEKQDGSTNWKPVIYAPFSADGFTASEILNKSSKAEGVAKMELTMSNRPLRNKPAQQPQAAASSQYPGFDDGLNDDIPW